MLLPLLSLPMFILPAYLSPPSLPPSPPLTVFFPPNLGLPIPNHPTATHPYSTLYVQVNDRQDKFTISQLLTYHYLIHN